jgi:RNase adaptor protein for sRNA GlmZ degradation
MGDTAVNGASDEEADFDVTIVSYGHSNGPLIVPREHGKLTFNVRDIPNPAAGLRRTHTGLSARLKKEVLASKEAQERLAEMVKAVNAKMDEMERERLRSPTVKSPTVKGGKVQHQEDVDLPSNTLVVGILCEEGRHRSVVFAEEVAHALKRRDWQVQVDHRDLSGYVNEEPETPTDVVSPTTGKPKKAKSRKEKNQETRRRKTSQRGSFFDEDD